MRSVWAVIGRVVACLSLSVILVPAARAEPVAPSVHWGAIAYPDQDETLVAGMTFNRFAEFDEAGGKFNPIQESAGFNFVTVSWTERIRRFPGWSTNLTVGAGPTHADPTLYLQNDFLHRLLGNQTEPVAQQRETTDFMFNGSLTRWAKLFGEREVGFAGLGFAAGSLYQEVFAQMGVRRLSLAEALEPVVGDSAFLRGFSRFVRISGMGRYGQVFGGAAFPNATVAAQAYLAQASISVASYDDHDGVPPRWELEFAFTIDSGLFADPSRHSIKRQFGSLALRFPYGVVETWNDVVGETDSGPTFGFQVMFDVRRIYKRLTSP
ncbi:MAG TPA: hypothetical protein VLA99_01095 [Nitrospiraceae bacterium]|nr:hypothetical protein [Nitrospiraceae bacterium]